MLHNFSFDQKFVVHGFKPYNDRARFFGWEINEIVGQSLYNFVPSDDQAKFQRKVLLLKPAEKAQISIRFQAKTGEIHYIFGHVSRTTLNEVFSYDFLDISIVRHEWASEIASILVHELNNPLTIIYGRASTLTQLIEPCKEHNPKLSTNVSKLEKATRRAIRLVEFLRIQYSSVVTPHKITASIENILSEVLEACEDRIEEQGIEIRKVGFPCSAELKCNALQLEQLFINLVLNSIDAIRERRQKWIEVSIKIKEKNIEISITDSGEGIPPGISSLIMQPYFTTKKDGQGLGLGLTICQKIADNHGGRLELDQSCKNTSFKVTLPLQQQPSSSHE